MNRSNIKKDLMALLSVFIILIIFVLVDNTIAQTPDFVWAQRAGGTSGTYGQAVTLDPANNNFIVGDFYGSATFGSITLTSVGYRDIFIAKYDAAGNVLWAQRAGGTSDDCGTGITNDGRCGIIITGYFSGSATFGSITLTSAGSVDIFIAKYDYSGNVLWARRAGGSSGDYGQAITTDSGDIIVTGYFNSSATFDSITLTSAGNSDIFIVKYDAAGNVLWAKSAGGSYEDCGRAITSDPSGNYTITGAFKGSAAFGSITVTGVGVRNIFIAKYNASGNVLWAKQADDVYNDYAYNYANDIAIDGEENIIVTGEWKPHYDEESDFFIAKFDASGNMLWRKLTGDFGDDAGCGIATDASGNVFVTGYFYLSLNFDGIVLSSTGSFDIFIAKYDASGNIQWATAAGGTGNDYAYDISTDDVNNCITIGYFYSDTATFGSINLINAGHIDMFIAKLGGGAPSWIAVTYPNGGEKWKVNESQTIIWSSLNISGNLTIEVSINGGNKWLPIDNNSTNKGIYIWTPTPDYISDSCTIKISQVTNELVFDQSDSLFCIAMKGDVNFDAAVNELDIQLIVDIALGTYLPSPCEFWAADCNDDGVVNVVDVQLAVNSFLANAKIKVISPNGGETWVVGAIKNITWDPSIVSSKVNIEISTNLGNSWSVIADSTENSGSYSWIPIPNYISDSCLIKISATGDTYSISDQSDAPFTITSRSEVTFLFPQQGWYLISLPVTPANNSLSVLFPTAIAAYAYNSATGNYYPVTSLETKKGYWLLIPAATNVTISGAPLTSYTEHYSTGWHLIGTMLGNTNFTDPKDNPNGSVITAYGYNPATEQYCPVYPPGIGILNEKEGYWLAVMQPCDLTIGGTKISKASLQATGNIELFKQQYGSQPPTPPFVVDPTVAQRLPNSHKIVSRNYPNPFNPETRIEYSLPKAGLTQVHVYNSLGQRIRTLLEAHQLTGFHQVIWNGRNDAGDLVTNGIYYYKITNAETVETKKMLLLR